MSHEHGRRRVPEMIDVFPEVYDFWDSRDLIVANAVRLSGTVNPSSSTDVLASA